MTLIAASDDRAGWLPDAVQLVANAAARAGLVPVVSADCEAIDLYAAGEALGCAGPVGDDVSLFLVETVHDERMDEDVPIEVRGLHAVLAWVSSAPLGQLAEQTVHDPDRG